MSVSFKNQLDKLSEISEYINENTELYQFIKQVNDLRNSNGLEKISAYRYTPYAGSSELKKLPFLSIILRSQGKRSLGLKEAFLSLRAQSCQDFEVIVIAHRASVEGKQIIKSIIESQPDSFRLKIKYLELNEGTRTTPINVGCANATGRYIAIYDDDDLLFDNWVEEFYQASQKSDGKILHAYVLAQKWKCTDQGFISMGAPTSQFCHPFDFLSQLVVNKCPLMGLAFPAHLFHQMGFWFNETLNVTEDWEYFMRVVPLTGISDIETPTSIYRLWLNAESSYTLHSQNLWDNTYQEIQTFMDQRTLLVPRGYTKHLVALIQRVNADEQKILSGYPKLHGLFYYGFSDIFSDENMLAAYNQAYIPHFRMTFTVPNVGTPFSFFRFDPCEYGGFILSDTYIHLVTSTDETIDLQLKDCKHNGFFYEDKIYFLHYDPQIIFCNPSSLHITSVTIEGTINMEIPEATIQAAIKQQCFVAKVKRKMKTMLKMLFHYPH